MMWKKKKLFRLKFCTEMEDNFFFNVIYLYIQTTKF